jgi:glycosyltransferase involved in cell wall biosynthesis
MHALAIFAHNESRTIRRCLDAINAAPLLEQTTCFVLANGCNDDTIHIAQQYAKSAPWVQVVEILVGDKANAWNVFVHEIAPVADCYFFLDGDCVVESGAFGALETALKQNVCINAASGVPSASNFSTGVYRREIINSGGLAGNLYALSGDFVRRIREMKVRLPVGFIGDDSLVGALALWDLEPMREWNHRHLVVCEQARFVYEPIWKTTLRNPWFYIRRQQRYSLRHFQNRLLAKHLKALGVSALPERVEDLYTSVTDAELKPRPSAVEYLFDLLTIRIIREKQHSS